jgi:hypothetical protein
MRVFDDKASSGMVRHFRQSIDRQLQRAEEKVVSHPEAGVLLATIFGVLLGIWMKRK